MPDDDNWKKVFEFLGDRFRSQEPFTRDDMGRVTTWVGTTFPTHFSKRLKQFVIPVKDGKFRVGESFRPFVANWRKFNRQIVTQVRRVAEDYVSLAYDSVLIFEFFMPLTNEGHLRTSLDALFYRETILNRLKSVEPEELTKRIPQNENEDSITYLNRVCAWVSDRFGGYSISHVSGRFKAAPLLSLREVADLQEKGGRYLVDETTAIVRFIFPCGQPIEHQPPLVGQQFGLFSLDNGACSPEVEEEADIIRWFFGLLFVQSIVQAVNGEDEIWMIESGMRSGLHIWRITD